MPSLIPQAVTDQGIQMTTMTRDFSFSLRTTLGFQECLDLLRQKLQREDFRVVSEVQFHREFAKSVGLPWGKYTVLVVWSPFHAYQALLSDRDGGLFMPFNVVIAEDTGYTSISVTNHASGGFSDGPIGIQVLVRELNHKMRQIFLELASHEIIPPHTSS
ncbi:MAG TPA: DUF302 domain-containing protein, partial [Candidatus Binatia bacterium]|nr:DUF302 domain-containing protein [Candidatus Binatia bacterium]